MSTKEKELCHDHGMSLPCPLCFHNAWPLRDLQAVADFAGKPVGGGDGYVPNLPMIAVEDIIRIIGSRWVELEFIKLTVLNPIYATKNALVREARIGIIDIGALEKAARLVAKGQYDPTGDRAVDYYVSLLAEVI